MKWWEDSGKMSENKLPYRAILKDLKQKIKSLNGNWKFKYFDDINLIDDNMELLEKGKWDKMVVPGAWECNGYGEPNYVNLKYLMPYNPPFINMPNPTGVYERNFKLKKQNKRYVLRMHGLDTIAKIWVNEKYVGLNKHARLTGEFDVTKFVKEGENVIRILVAKFSDMSYIEDQDMFRYGGIFRDVELIEEPKSGIRDVYFKTKFKGKKAIIEVHGVTTKNMKAQLILKDAEKKVLVDKSISFGENVDTFEIISPKLWSAENPYLYEVSISTNDQNIVHRLGVKKVQLKDRKILVNGVPIKIKGINMHDFTNNNGRAMTKEDMLKNLYLAKQTNINAIRTSHYPKSYWFYEMCDELGLWVMDEADVETHGAEWAGNWCELANNMEYITHHVEKAKQMVLRDRNYVSIVSFSLGNESGTGKAFKEMTKFIKNNSNNIFVHYEGDYTAEYADVSSTMYPKLESTKLLLSKEKGGSDDDPLNSLDSYKAGELHGKKYSTLLNKPHIDCEYAHCMGNGPGSLIDYWDKYYSDDMFMGGYLWEWFDHAVKIKGDKDFKYGGDFKHVKHDTNFCVDGMVFPDGKPSPTIQQTKAVYAPIYLEPSKNGKEVKVINHMNFLQPNEVMDLVIEKKSQTGEIIETRIIDIPNIERHSSMTISTELMDTNNFIIKIAARPKIMLKWMPKEYLFQTNSVFVGKLNNVEKANCWKVIDKKNFVVSNKQVTYAIDKVTGGFSISDSDGEILSGNRMGFFRPHTDNERGVVHQWRDPFFLNVTYNRMKSIDIVSESPLTIKVVTAIGCPGQSWSYENKISYIFGENGLSVQQHLLPQWNITLPKNDIYFDFGMRFKIPKVALIPQFFPRMGFDFEVHKSFENISYIGLGPTENYADSKFGSYTDVHKTNINDLWTNYVRPQENGNREEVKLLSIANDKKIINIKSEIGLSFNYRPFSINNIEQATHPSELNDESTNFLSLNYKNGALGSNACGPLPLMKHLIRFKEFKFNYDINVKRKK